MKKQALYFFIYFFNLFLIQSQINAQEMSVIGEGFNQPIGIELDGSGNLWIAEAGTGNGDGSISVIWSSGTISRVIDSLPSVFDTTTMETVGPYRLKILDPATIAIFTPNVGNNPGVSLLIYATDSLTPGRTLKMDDASSVIPISQYVLRMGHEESNPFSLVHDGCDMYIVDAAANAIVRRNGLTNVFDQIASFPPSANPLPFGPPFVDAVPTQILANPEGGFIVSQLTGFPFITGASKLYNVSMDGTVTVRDSGLTLVTDIGWESSGDGIVALQYANFNGDSIPPFLIGSSMLIHLHADGSRDSIAAGFGPSAGLAIGSDGIYYATQQFFGTVLKIETMSTNIFEPNRVEFERMNIYPNPVTTDLNIEVNLQEGNKLSLEIYDVQGRQITNKDLGFYPAGFHTIGFNGDKLPVSQSTVQPYFVKLTAGKHIYHASFIKQ